MTAPAPTRRIAPVHPDRRTLQRWLLVGIVIATAAGTAAAGLAAAARGGGDPIIGLVSGAGAGALAVVGLRSLSVRLVARSFLVLSGGVLVRFGALRGSLAAGSPEVLVFVAAAVAVFVLTDRIGTDGQLGLRQPTADRRSPRPVGGSELGRAEPARTARTALLTTGAVVLAALLLVPLVLPRMSDATSAGEGPRADGDGGSAAALGASDSLDMTTRPELTDEVVLRITTDRPTFWRGETFDQWDGRSWTRSDPSRFAVGEDVVTGPEDLAADGRDEFTQRIRVEAGYAEVLYGAPSIVTVDARQALAQRPDGTVTTAGTAMGRGATYEVTSRRQVLTEQRLRSAEGPIPPEILAQYAQPPEITSRVLDAAVEVAGDAPTTFDKIKALEAWMGERTEYSLDAPLSPEGVDVVDHFLFDSRQGWCEQVASSLTVMARANGIPARLVSGFVPADRDSVTGTYLVRQQDAHSWTEVWFPEVGWVAFDPTANVPLAATVVEDTTWTQWLLDHALVVLLAIAVLAVVGWSAVRLLRRWRDRLRAERSLARTWAAGADRRLVGLGLRVGRPRGPGETTTSYGHALVDRYHDPRLAAIGAAVDESLFAAAEPEPDRRNALDALLDEIEALDPPPPTPDPDRATSV